MRDSPHAGSVFALADEATSVQRPGHECVADGGLAAQVQAEVMIHSAQSSQFSSPGGNGYTLPEENHQSRPRLRIAALSSIGFSSKQLCFGEAAVAKFRQSLEIILDVLARLLPIKRG